MLLNLFKSQQPISIVFIIIFSFLLWINPFAITNEISLLNDGNMPLYALLLKVFSPGSYISIFVGFLFLITIAFLLSRLNLKYIFITERSYLPSIIYIILVIGIANIHDLHAFLPASLLIILAIDRLFDTYKNDHLSYKPFDASLILGIATLFYFNTIYFILFVWISLLVLRPFYWREWIFSVLGLVIPSFFYFSICKLSGNSIHLFENFNIEFAFKKIQLTSFQITFSVLVLILILISSQFLIRSLGSKKIFTRKCYNLFLILFLNSVLIFLGVKNAFIELTSIAAIPLSILFSHYFVTAKQTRVLNIIFFLFIFAFILSQIIPI